MVRIPEWNLTRMLGQPVQAVDDYGNSIAAILMRIDGDEACIMRVVGDGVKWVRIDRLHYPPRDAAGLRGSQCNAASSVIGSKLSRRSNKPLCYWSGFV